VGIKKVQDDVESEMRRLKLELKQTMDMYSTACREALTAKQKVLKRHVYFVYSQHSKKVSNVIFTIGNGAESLEN
jgi:hypothetical protein